MTERDGYLDRVGGAVLDLMDAKGLTPEEIVKVLSLLYVATYTTWAKGEKK